MPPAAVVLADLGELSNLPLELLFMIIGYLDLPSAAKFTGVNRQAQFILWSDRDYLLLRGSLFRSLGLPSWLKFIARVPLKDIDYHTLADNIRNMTCARCKCSDEDNYELHPLTGRMLCFRCLWCLTPVSNPRAEITVYRDMVENRIPYRLPEGRLILVEPWDVTQEE
ncbi:hypothetical protein F5Y10DRAFT_264428 [Nemania abortiva]|nr:hypothetical protein F5Y10DRAFT_264428 [Nemania abortiva]